MTFQFNVPSTVIAGVGAADQLTAQLARLSVSRVLLVTDGFMVSVGVAQRFIDQMVAAGLACVVYDEVEPDPTDACVRKGAAAYIAEGCEAIVALGGGSPMDAAKAMAVLVTNGEPLSRMEGQGKVAQAGAPLIVIPTTAGTGSEVTRVAVITDTERDVKMLIMDPRLLPTVALVDPQLTYSMPPALTAHVGIDTLTHGIEAYVSRKANAFTDPLALGCIDLVAAHLETAFHHPDDAKAREGMMLAATLGGMAFANASVALVHGMARPIGALFHVPHGLSNAVLLPTVTAFSLPGALDRYATISRRMGYADGQTPDQAAAEALVDGLSGLTRRLAVPRLGGCRGVTREAFEAALPKMAVDALASGSPQNNPVLASEAQIIDLYKSAY